MKGHFTDVDEIDHLVGEGGSSPGQTSGQTSSKIGKQKSIGDHQAAGDRSAAKVLSCLRCGASFESLQERMHNINYVLLKKWICY